jgi:hypothetical protein
VTQTGHRRSKLFALRNLLDHLVGTQQNRLRYRQAERLGGLEVDDHLKFCRQLNGQLRRFRSAQDAIHISGGATKGVYLADARPPQQARERTRRLVIIGLTPIIALVVDPV